MIAGGEDTISQNYRDKRGKRFMCVSNIARGICQKPGQYICLCRCSV